MEHCNLFEHIEKLRYFVSIVEHESLGKAAEHLHISQPSLSRTVKTLEEILSLQLLERNHLGIKPTPAGQKLFEYGQELLLQAQRIETELRMIDEKSILLNIGTKESIGEHYWPHIQNSFSDQSLKLTIRRSNKELMKNLLEEKITLAILAEAKQTEGVREYLITRDQFAFFTSPTLVLNERTPILVFGASVAGRGQTILDLMEANGIPKDRIQNVDSYGVCITMAAKGHGAAVLPQRIASGSAIFCNLVQVPINKLRTFGDVRISACVLERHARHPIIRSVIRTLKSVST